MADETTSRLKANENPEGNDDRKVATAPATARSRKPRVPNSKDRNADGANGADEFAANAVARADHSGADYRHHLAEMRRDPETIRRLFENGEYPYHTKMRRAVYEGQKANLQVELLKVQRWVKETGQRIVILFEGRDAAGKGGAIKRFMEHLNPRGARVVALEKPTLEQQGQWYFQRYVEHLPTAGEIVLFDRSWYNRAGVERVMGFCSASDYLEFMRQVPELGSGLITRR